MPDTPSDKRRKAFYAARNVLSKKEREVISYYELQYVMRQRVPTITETAKFCKIPETEASLYLTKKNVQKALDKRGIPWKQHTQDELTHQQIATAIVMMNFADTRTNEQKLDQLGVNAQQYQAWLLDPQFKNLISNLSEQNLSNIKETAIGELTKKIYGGDWQAVRFYLETTGSIEKTEAPQSEKILMFLIEILQEEIKDPVLMDKIGTRIQQALANRTLEITERVIEGQPPPQSQTQDLGQNREEELANARRMLGV